MGPPDEAPTCPNCDQPVTWQLTHLASSVAADHKGAGHLPVAPSEASGGAGHQRAERGPEPVDIDVQRHPPRREPRG